MYFYLRSDAQVSQIVTKLRVERNVIDRYLRFAWENARVHFHLFSRRTSLVSQVISLEGMRSASDSTSKRIGTKEWAHR